VATFQEEHHASFTVTSESRSQMLDFIVYRIQLGMIRYKDKYLFSKQVSVKSL
jgi:hypothetical protein